MLAIIGSVLHSIPCNMSYCRVKNAGLLSLHPNEQSPSVYLGFQRTAEAVSHLGTNAMQHFSPPKRTPFSLLQSGTAPFLGQSGLGPKNRPVLGSPPSASICQRCGRGIFFHNWIAWEQTAASSSSGSGAPSNTRRSTATNTTRCCTCAPASRITSHSTITEVPTAHWASSSQGDRISSNHAPCEFWACRLSPRSRISWRNASSMAQLRRMRRTLRRLTNDFVHVGRC